MVGDASVSSDGEPHVRIFPLSIIEEGKTVRVVKVLGGRGLARRLYEIGLLPGAEIEVVRNSKHGPVIVRNKIAGTFSLGYGVARKIVVEVVR